MNTFICMCVYNTNMETKSYDVSNFGRIQIKQKKRELRKVHGLTADIRVVGDELIVEIE